MRIGIDCTMLDGDQKFRGIGRYSRALAAAFFADCWTEHEFFMHTKAGTDPQLPPSGLNVQERPVRELEPALHGNPDRLDAILLLSPHESHLAFSRCGIPLIATVIYDLIPGKLRDQYLRLEEYRRTYDRYLRAIRNYDLFLSISNATRMEFTGIGFDPDRIVTIGAGIDHRRFRARRPGDAFPEALQDLGVKLPYILHVGGEDPRKGGQELMEAFSKLPRELRTKFSLVYAYAMGETARWGLQKTASQLGIGQQFLATGLVDDATMVSLFQHAMLHCLPSKAEGLGIPHLEAMACGVPTIGGNDAAQREVIGDAGYCIDPTVPAIRNTLWLLLEDEDLREKLSAAGRIQASGFRWEDVAEHAIIALTNDRFPRPAAPHWPDPTEPAEEAPTIVAVAGHHKPRLALFSPVPPVISGISPYGIELARALREHYKVTVFHDPEVEPDPADGVSFRPASKFNPRFWERRLYQMGNSHYHAFMLDAIEAAPGVVTFHDLNLSGLELWLQVGGGRRYSAMFGALQTIGDQARRIVVHAGFNLSQLPPELLEKAAIIPFGAREHVLSPGMRTQIRGHHKLPYGQILAVGGIIHETKCPGDVVRAFSRGRRELLDWSMAWIGPEADGGETRALIASLGLGSRSIWLGELSHGDFANVMAASDLAICLRRPPTNGETSAAMMDALRAGVPTIVNSVGTFAELPNDAARKVPPGDADALFEALVKLGTDPRARRDLGVGGLLHIRRRHRWDDVARRYAETIEEAVVNAAV